MYPRSYEQQDKDYKMPKRNMDRFGNSIYRSQHPPLDSRPSSEMTDEEETDSEDIKPLYAGKLMVSVPEFTDTLLLARTTIPDSENITYMDKMYTDSLLSNSYEFATYTNAASSRLENTNQGADIHSQLRMISQSIETPVPTKIATHPPPSIAAPIFTKPATYLFLKIRVRPTGTICELETTDSVLIGKLIKDVCQKSGLNQPADHYYLMYNGQELNVNSTVGESGLINTINSTDENYPELRLKFLHLLNESPHLATNIILTTPEELVYRELFEIPYSPTQEQILPKILEPLIKTIDRNKSQSPKISSNLVSMPVFTKQVIDDLPTLHITLPLKPNEFDSNAFMQCLAADLAIDRNDMFLMSIQEGSTKYKIKFKADISLNPEKMKQIAARVNMIALPSSKSTAFIAQQKSLDNIKEIPKIEASLDGVGEIAHLSSSKTLAYDDINALLSLMQRPAIVDPPIWEYLIQKSRKISIGILHAFQTSEIEYVIESMSLVHNEEVYHKYSKCTVGGEEKILFHGTKLHNLNNIFDTNFKTFYTANPDHIHITDSGWYGQGVYFSSSPKYCATYAGSTSNGIMYLICSLVKLGEVYHVKDMSYQGKPMRTDSDTHYVKVNQSGHPINAEHSFFEEFVIKQSEQILPLYIIGLRQVQRFVLWRDAKITNSENSNVFAQMKGRYSFNIYGSETTSEALAVLKLKLADPSMQCVVVTNGADNGKHFAQECRKIRATVPIIVFCSNVLFHQQWATEISGSGQPPIQVTGGSNSVFTFISANFPS